MNDEQIVEMFFHRNENAVSEIDSKYRNIYLKITSNILDSDEDRKECLNDLYLSLWTKIPPEKPKSLLAFSVKIIRNISINKFKYNKSHKRNNLYAECLEELDFSLSNIDTESEFDERETSRCIDDFIKTLDYTSRLIFVRRYWYIDSYEDLSKITGLREGAIRTKLSRIRKKLKIYFAEKGVLL